MPRFKEHIYALAQELGVQAELYDEPGSPTLYSLRPGIVGGQAWPTYIEVWGWSVDPERAYLSALHELGHMDAGDTWDNRAAYEADRVTAEARAWEWALARATLLPQLTVEHVEWITGPMALGSYTRAHGMTPAAELFRLSALARAA